eukprot:547030_1
MRTEKQPKTLDILPLVLLSKICNNLQFTDRIRFEQCNRSMLIASRSSNIPVYSLNKYQFTSLAKCYHKNNNQFIPHSKLFKSVIISQDNQTNHRNIGLMDWDPNKQTEYTKYKWNNLHLLKHITELQIGDSIQRGSGFMFQSQVNEIVLHLNACNFDDLSNIQTLRIMTSICDKTTFDMFMSIIQSKLKLQYFEYVFRAIWKNVHHIYGHEWISNLKGIAVVNELDNDNKDNIMNSVYPLIGNNLLSLHIGKCIITDDINAKLNKLNELCLPMDATKQQMEMLMKIFMKYLTRVNLRGPIGFSPYVQQETMKLWIDKIIGRLQYISLDASSHKRTVCCIMDILDILMKSLKQIKIKKTKLKIKIDTRTKNGYFDMFWFKQVTQKMQEFVNILDLSCVDWMLVFNWFSLKDDVLLRLDKSWKNMKQKYCIIFNENRCIINNKNCKIIGCDEQWIMNCKSCKKHVSWN